jgi:cell division protein FtsB
MELEEWRRKASDMDANLQAKYHKALKQIEVMHKDNSELKTENNKLRGDINNWKGKLEALEKSKNRELEDLRMSLETKRKSEIDREVR